MRKLVALLFPLAILLLSTHPAPAQAPQGFVAEYLQQLDDLQTKIVSLAEAMPEPKYAWRPGTGVRSVGEVYTHIAGSNRAVAKLLGSSTDAASAAPKTKAEILADLKDSFSTLRATALKVSDPDKPIDLRGKPVTTRSLMIRSLGHLHEHLGQSIAYARTNAITPPWSQKTAD